LDSTIFASAREVERHGGAIVRLYRTALARVPDGIGLRSFAGFLRNGGTAGEMAEQLTGSPEFMHLHASGLPDLAYIRRLHENATGLVPRDVDIAGPLALSAAGGSRAVLLAAVAESGAARGAISLLRAIGPARPRPDDEYAYQLWLADYPELTDADRAGIHAHIATMPAPPLLTLLMAAPQYRVDLALETIESITRQLYPNVELRIALPVDASPATSDALTHAARNSPGIVLVATGSIAAAFANSEGLFAGIVEPGDQLAPEALYLVAAAIQAAPDAIVVYSDEDRIDGDGSRHAPRLKTGWNPDLLFAGDAIGQLAMIRAERWREVGGPRADADPYQRLDLVLRALGANAAATHVPFIMFHRGRGGRKRPPEFPDSVATTQRPRLLEIVRGHMALTRSPAALDETILANRLWPRIAFPVPDPAPLVSVIIPTRDRGDLLEARVTGLLARTDYPAIEVLIVDNGSVEPATKQLLNQLGRDRRVRVLPAAGPFNYAAMNNEAARQARGGILLLLNNDVTVTEPDWRREMVGHAMRPDVGAVGAKLLYPDGTLQHAGLMLGPDGGAKHILRRSTDDAAGYLGQLALARDVAAVTGACLAIRRAVFEEIGGLDEDLRVTWNDIDLCLRLRAKAYRVVWTPHAVLTHVELATRGAENPTRFDAERGRLLARWGDAFDSDPFQNPALLATDDDLLLATPPRRRKPWLEWDKAT